MKDLVRDSARSLRRDSLTAGVGGHRLIGVGIVPRIGDPAVTNRASQRAAAPGPAAGQASGRWAGLVLRGRPRSSDLDEDCREPLGPSEHNPDRRTDLHPTEV